MVDEISTPRFENGLLKLPNHKMYRISDIKIAGKAVTFGDGGAKEAVQNLILQSLAATGETFRNTTINEILIKTHADDNKAEVTLFGNRNVQKSREVDVSGLHTQIDKIRELATPLQPPRAKSPVEGLAEKVEEAANEPLDEVAEANNSINQLYGNPVLPIDQGDIKRQLELDEQVKDYLIRKGGTQETLTRTTKRTPVVFDDIAHVETQLKHATGKEKAFYKTQRLALYNFLEEAWYVDIKHEAKPDPDLFTRGQPDEDLQDEDLKKYMKDLYENCKTEKRHTWLSSQYVRGQLLPVFGTKEGWKRYISAPINMRVQSLKVQEKEHKFVRLGVISDLRDGTVSLTDLKKLEGMDSETREAQLDAIIERLQKIKSEHIPPMIDKLTKIRDGTLPLDEVIADRRRHMQKQMLHLIAKQVAENPKLIQDNTFQMLHVSLLNQNKCKLEKQGWLHDERVEMEDMDEIFREFDDKQICFHNNPDESFYMEEGVIYLPSAEGNKPPLTLRTHFLNISVQKDTKHEGVQQKIDDRTLATLSENNNLQAPKEKLEEALEYLETTWVGRGRSAFEATQQFIKEVLERESMAVSIGCASAKDRTGEIAHLVTQNFLSERIKIIAEDPEANNPFEDDRSEDIFIAWQNEGTQRVLKGNITNMPISRGIELITSHVKAKMEQQRGTKRIPPPPLERESVVWISRP